MVEPQPACVHFAKVRSRENVDSGRDDDEPEQVAVGKERCEGFPSWVEEVNACKYANDAAYGEKSIKDQNDA